MKTFSVLLLMPLLYASNCDGPEGHMEIAGKVSRTFSDLPKGESVCTLTARTSHSGGLCIWPDDVDVTLSFIKLGIPKIIGDYSNPDLHSVEKPAGYTGLSVQNHNGKSSPCWVYVDQLTYCCTPKMVNASVA